MEFIIITGLSGAGKSVAMRNMEDIGYYCVDNIPPTLLPTFYDLCEKSSDEHLKKVAVPVRLENNKIGMAHITAARTRPKFIGGIRAVYDDKLM